MRFATLLLIAVSLLACARLASLAVEPADTESETTAPVDAAPSDTVPTTEEAPAAGEAPEATIDFNRQIRPILANRCYTCHGPDEATREAELRFDVPEAAYEELPSGNVAIVPGDAESSEMVYRIFSDDEFEQMPPPEAEKHLTEQERELLRAWVEQGAVYNQHWSFVPPIQAPLPEVADREWCRNPIDHFVLARLEAAGLEPSQEADRYTLIRRLYLDLLGVLPEPAEVDAFVADSRPEAYDLLVDRLLASPRYGERWARPWLDLARYADTNGYEKDQVRSIWPYRDWVIRALNADMPFDQFTIEQIAGDMLPAATPEQIIATGFHRNTMINEEGGIDPQEFRYYAQVDRVNTTGTVWLGLTLGCSQCHSHKYDPLLQNEYYELMAFFDQADDTQFDVPSAEIDQRREEILDQIQAVETEMADRLQASPDLQESLAHWSTEQSAATVPWSVLRPTELESNQPLLTVLEDNSVLATGDEAKSETLHVTVDCDLPRITAIRLEALPHELLPNGGPGRAVISGPLERPGRFLLSEFQLLADGLPVSLIGASETFADGNNKAAGAIDGDPQSGWANNGAIGSRVVAVFQLAQPLAVEPGTRLTFMLHCEAFYSSGIGRFRLSAAASDDPAADPVSASPLPAKVEEFLLVPYEDRTPSQQQQVTQYWFEVAEEFATERQEIEQLRGSLPAYDTTLVMRQRPREHYRITHRHHRGEFLQGREEVSAGVHDSLHDLPDLTDDTPHDRLSLARWLVDENNPLVARVTVNRDWAAIFGRGIVRTTEDFGAQGELPSHPELLDWLSVEFMQKGWSRKELHRLIVSCSTYRQSSSASEDLLEADPQNELLSRGPRLRLEGELIRDAALSACGLLSDKMLGPSVFPPQPGGVTDQSYGGLAWNTSPGEDRYRRGLYTFAKRTTPYAMFSVFDAPSGELCVARRSKSNTPLQALTLLNDQVLTEAAQTLARRAIESENRERETAGRIEIMFRWCLVRPPQAEELAALSEFYETQLARLAAGELEAAPLAGPPAEETTDGATDVATALNEQAALATVARVLLNLDEMVSKN